MPTGECRGDVCFPKICFADEQCPKGEKCIARVCIPPCDNKEGFNLFMS